MKGLLGVLIPLAFIGVVAIVDAIRRWYRRWQDELEYQQNMDELRHEAMRGLVEVTPPAAAKEIPAPVRGKRTQ